MCPIPLTVRKLYHTLPLLRGRFSDDRCGFSAFFQADEEMAVQNGLKVLLADIFHRIVDGDEDFFGQPVE
jgi:hypothetical protein